jgi:hypothetical protein
MLRSKFESRFLFIALFSLDTKFYRQRDVEYMKKVHTLLVTLDICITLWSRNVFEKTILVKLMTNVSALHGAWKYLSSADEALFCTIRQSIPSHPRALFWNIIIEILLKSKM